MAVEPSTVPTAIYYTKSDLNLLIGIYTGGLSGHWQTRIEDLWFSSYEYEGVIDEWSDRIKTDENNELFEKYIDDLFKSGIWLLNVDLVDPPPDDPWDGIDRYFNSRQPDMSDAIVLERIDDKGYYEITDSVIIDLVRGPAPFDLDIGVEVPPDEEPTNKFTKVRREWTALYNCVLSFWYGYDRTFGKDIRIYRDNELIDTMPINSSSKESRFVSIVLEAGQKMIYEYDMTGGYIPINSVGSIRLDSFRVRDIDNSTTFITDNTALSQYFDIDENFEYTFTHDAIDQRWYSTAGENKSTTTRAWTYPIAELKLTAKQDCNLKFTYDYDVNTTINSMFVIRVLTPELDVKEEIWTSGTGFGSVGSKVDTVIVALKRNEILHFVHCNRSMMSSVEHAIFYDVSVEVYSEETGGAATNGIYLGKYKKALISGTDFDKYFIPRLYSNYEFPENGNIFDIYDVNFLTTSLGNTSVEFLINYIDMPDTFYAFEAKNDCYLNLRLKLEWGGTSSCLVARYNDSQSSYIFNYDYDNGEISVDNTRLVNLKKGEMIVVEYYPRDPIAGDSISFEFDQIYVDQSVANEVKKIYVGGKNETVTETVELNAGNIEGNNFVSAISVTEDQYGSNYLPFTSDLIAGCVGKNDIVPTRSLMYFTALRDIKDIMIWCKYSISEGNELIASHEWMNEDGTKDGVGVGYGPGPTNTGWFTPMSSIDRGFKKGDILKFEYNKKVAHTDSYTEQCVITNIIVNYEKAADAISPITQSNFAVYFDVELGSPYTFDYSPAIYGETRWTAGNLGVDSSTASILFKAKRDLNNISISYKYVTESSYDKFYMISTNVGANLSNAVTNSNTVIANNASGTSGDIITWNGSLKTGEGIFVRYTKDGSQHASGETCWFGDITISYEGAIDNVARKVKKAYIGVNGVARLCYSSE